MLTCYFEDNKQASLRHVVIDTLVLQNNKILLVKRVASLLEGGKWGIIGGFVERDETLQQAVEREMFEETGYKTRDITLLTIRDNPDRPGDNGRQNISFVFFCEALEKEGEADEESTERRWFGLDDLPDERQIAFDHYQNIQLYLRYLEEGMRLPVV